MAPDGVEMLVGVVQDQHFGPVLACGAGGTATELLKDVAVRITPITKREADQMVRSLKTFPQIDGYRGAPRADVAALEDVLLRVSALVEAHAEIARCTSTRSSSTPQARSSSTPRSTKRQIGHSARSAAAERAF